MANKLSKKELLEALKDPDLLKEAGLVRMSDQEEKELFSDIEVGDDDSVKDVVGKFNAKLKKQKAYYDKQQKDTLKTAKAEAGAGEAARKDREVNAFLKDHPALSSNKELLGLVEPLYAKGLTLEDAYTKGCKALDLDPTTGEVPKTDEEKKEEKGTEKKSEKKTSLRSDTEDTKKGDAEEEKGGDEKPKTIREIASEQLNSMTAKGTNPWRPTDAD